jgi:CMP-N,N'-diacetyllegionaminic acid synthase
VLAVIPARGGSKGLPGKNILSFVGLPLISHTILFARLCPEITRCIVSTDSPEIADVARQYQGDVPFIRPSELAQDDTPMWPVLQHALRQVEHETGESYDYVLLLDPTSPAREPADISQILDRLQQRSVANGIVGVSKPDFNPVWNCVVETDGWMGDLVTGGSDYNRRQDAPDIYRINGSLYLWRAEFVRTEGRSWRQTGGHLIHEIPEIRAMSLDSAIEFQKAELMVKGGLISLPWLADLPANI